MLRVLGSPKRLCNGLTRRDFLEVGGLGVLGAGLSDLLRSSETNAACVTGTLLAYTDGITKAMSASGEMFGYRRLERIFQSVPPDPRQAGEAVVRAVTEFAAGCHQSDDISLICFGRELTR